MQSLQDSILDRLYGFLASHEALALSATCRRFYPRTSSAYRELRFRLGRVDNPAIFVQTTENAERLLGVLRAHPRYAANVRSIVLCDPPAATAAAQGSGAHWQGWRPLADEFDSRLAQVVDLCTQLRRFIWSDYAFGTYLPVNLTMESLKGLRHLCALSLYWVEVERPAPNAEVALTATCKLEEITLDCGGGGSPFWCLPFLQQNCALRSLRLMYVAEDNDEGWLEELCKAGVSWRNLESLTICCTAAAIPTMIRFMKYCAVS
jgi:hypothetical protein